jgi:hypothetical protein
MSGATRPGQSSKTFPDTNELTPRLPGVSLPRVQKLALYSAVPPQPLLMQFDAGFIASPSDRSEIQRLWDRTNRAYGGLEGPDRSLVNPTDTRPLEGVDDVVIEAVLARTRLYPPFDSHPPQLVAVRLSKVVTPQLTVSLPRADRRTRVAAGSSDRDLLEVSTSPSAMAEPVHHQVLAQLPNQGAVIFTSYDEDVRPHVPVFRSLELEPRDNASRVLPTFCIPVGGGIPFVSGQRVSILPGKDRIVITNGIHRAFSIARAGCEWIPMVLCSVSGVEMPPQVVELPNQLILNPGANPPVLTDFLNDSVAMRLEYYPVLKVVRVNWATEQLATVLR